MTDEIIANRIERLVAEEHNLCASANRSNATTSTSSRRTATG
jgi:hypothetical protein